MGPCLRLLALAIPIALLPLVPACGRESAVAPGAGRDDRPLAIVLVSIDTLRADYLGTYGYTRFPTSPVIDAFAREAVVFDDCIATEPWTLTSHMSLFTGLHPAAHGVGEDTALAPEIPTLAGALRSAGYRTAAFTDGGWMSARWGFDRGFDEFHEGTLGGLVDLAPRAVRWMREQRDEPFFLFLHTFDVHSDGLIPYYAKSGGRGRFSRGSSSPLRVKGRKAFRDRFRKRKDRLSADDVDYLRATYAEGVRHADEQVGVVLGALRELGLADRALVVLWSDHGDALFDHGDEWSHGQLYDHTIRVPLLLRGPGLPTGRRVATTVSSVDIAPTILSLAGAPVPDGMGGRSLLDRIEGRADAAPEPVFSRRVRRGRALYSVHTERHQLLWDRVANRWELYDREADPRSEHDLHGQAPDVEAPLRRRLVAWVEAQDAGRDAAGVAVELAPDQEEQLRALGYLE